MQAIDQIINSAGKLYYMSGGTVHCPVTFRGPNGAAAGVAAQHSQVSSFPPLTAFPGLERRSQALRVVSSLPERHGLCCSGMLCDSH